MNIDNNEKPKDLTDHEGWPKHLKQLEAESRSIVQALLESNLNFSKFAELLNVIIEIPRNNNTFKQVMDRVFKRRKSDNQTIKNLLEVLIKNEQLIKIIELNMFSRQQLKEKFAGTEYEDDILLIYTIHNQELAQLFFQALLHEDKHDSVAKISILLHTMAKFNNWLSESRSGNQLLNFLNGVKAEAGLAKMLQDIGASIIFPDFTNPDEISVWDLKNGVDFVCIKDTRILLIDTRANQTNNSKDAKQNIQSGLGASISSWPKKPIHYEIAQQALTEVLNSKQRDKLHSDKITDYTVECVSLTVPAHPSQMNHFGRLNKQTANTLITKMKQIGVI